MGKQQSKEVVIAQNGAGNSATASELEYLKNAFTPNYILVTICVVLLFGGGIWLARYYRKCHGKWIGRRGSEMDLRRSLSLFRRHQREGVSAAATVSYVNSWWLMSTSMTPAFILATYLLFVIKIGPNYMKDRKPYNLQNFMTLYNVVQVIVSTYLVYVNGRMLVYNGLVPETCSLETEFNRRGIALAMHSYLLTKFSELLDTVFFVLRKKEKQISFLHVYHHTLMVIVTWTALKYEPTIHLLFLGSVNSFVHVIMYTYYGLSAFPSFAKYLWWKKYITTLQLVQFIAVLLHFIAAYVYSQCTPSKILIMALSSNLILFLFLFGQFYFKNYSKNTARQLKEK